MYESQVAEHKMDIDRLQRELQEVKKKYLFQKKREHMLKQVATKKKVFITFFLSGRGIE